jgi:septum formation protein
MLQELLKKNKIILASGSPRRQQFFKDLNIPFTLKLFDVKEIYPDTLYKEEIPEYLARLKAKPFEGVLAKNEIAITSDTVVWLENEALGKPQNRTMAFEMLQKLSGSKHEVITSVCIKTNSFEKTITDSTFVYFSELTYDEINYYLDNYKPFDKAGSYGIQEWIGFIGVEKIEGSYFNVMGLPVQKLYRALKEIQNNESSAHETIL